MTSRQLGRKGFLNTEAMGSAEAFRGKEGDHRPGYENGRDDKNDNKKCSHNYEVTALHNLPLAILDSKQFR